MPRAHRFGSAALLALLVAACSSAGDATPGADGPGVPPPEATTAPPPAATGTPGSAGPRECAPPPPGAPSTVTVVPNAPRATISLPAQISGTTTEGIDFVSFDIVLSDVAKLRLSGGVTDFTDASERTGIGIEVRSKVHDKNTPVVKLHFDPSTPSDEDASGWLYPGAYEILFSRATYASANANAPTLPHAYRFQVDVERPPVVEGGCTLPAGAASDRDVRASAACNAWCTKLPSCGTGCREDCDVPVGQCTASVEKRLACLASATFSCVSRAGATGYSIDADCRLDASVCAPGDIRN